MTPRPSGTPAREITRGLVQVRAELDALVACLPGGPRDWPCAPALNPPRWEYGHVVWFQEHWCLRLKPGRDPRASPLLEPLEPSRQAWADWLFDSSRIPHRARWDAPLPEWARLRAWAGDVQADVLARLTATQPPDGLLYHAELSLAHECMHVEAWWMMYQIMGIAPPRVPALPALGPCAALRFEDTEVLLGTPAGAAHFAFDNERDAHPARVGAFECDSRPVSCAEYARFVDAGGYDLDGCWDEHGRRWRNAAGSRHPLWWREAADGWQVRRFDRWIPLPGDEPVMHVNRHEARAYAAWLGRRLPAAAEWLRAAAHPDFSAGPCWEWTSDAFSPYPGFAPGPYADYSLPWFGSHAEVRGGGSWVTHASLARPTMRNFYLPERRDPFVGFRTAGGASPAVPGRVR